MMDYSLPHGVTADGLVRPAVTLATVVPHVSTSPSLVTKATVVAMREHTFSVLGWNTVVSCSSI